MLLNVVVKYQVNYIKNPNLYAYKTINKNLQDLPNFSHKHVKDSDSKVMHSESVLIACYIRYRQTKDSLR